MKFSMEVDLDQILTERIAAHFHSATISEDNVVDLGFGGLQLACHVSGVQSLGSLYATSLFFHLYGQDTGLRPIFLSVSGYEAEVEAAVVQGACEWACTFGKVLEFGFTGERQHATNQEDFHQLSTSFRGQKVTVAVDRMDRVLSAGDDAPDIAAILKRSQTTLAGQRQWLTEVLLESVHLPLLDLRKPNIISTFISNHEDMRIIEVKVNGENWPLAERAFADTRFTANHPGAALLRVCQLVEGTAQSLLFFCAVN